LADAVEQMVAGRAPSTPTAAPIAEPLTVLSIGALAVVLAIVGDGLHGTRRWREHGGATPSLQQGKSSCGLPRNQKRVLSKTNEARVRGATDDS
jgi:hypothetical protein